MSSQLKPAEDDLSPFFAQSLDLLCIAGLDGYFKRINPAWQTTLGWELEELQSQPFLDFVHPDDRQVTVAEVGKIVEGAVTHTFENRYRGKDGGYKWLQWNARPVLDHQRIYAIARDVTDQKQLEREILEISDWEKERLGRELHDGLCQNLAGIAALSTALSRKLTAGSDSAAAAAEISRLLNESIGQARDLARGLNPVGLEQIGLGAALEVLVAHVQTMYRVLCTFQCPHPVPQLGPAIEAQLYRIAQEAVHNAMSHGQSKRIEISLSVRAGTGILRIQDDGVGVSQQTVAGQGMGLHTMHYRSRLIGGSLQVQRLPQHGTAVSCRFRLLPDPPQEGCQARQKD